MSAGTYDADDMVFSDTGSGVGDGHRRFVKNAGALFGAPLAARMAMRTTYGALLASSVVASSVSLLLLGCGTANGNGTGGTSGTGPTCTQPDGTRAITPPPSSSGTGVEAREARSEGRG